VPNNLEYELAGLMKDAGFGETQALAVSVRLGFDGLGGATLQHAADVAGYSRERVRQLESMLARHAARAQPRLIAVEAALDIVEAAVPDERRHIADLVARAGVAASPFDPAGILAAADLVGLRSSATLCGHLVAARNVVAPDVALLRTATALADGLGEVTVPLLARCAGLDVARVGRLLGSRADSLAASGLHTPRLERRVARVLRKMLSVTRGVSLSEVQGALSRTDRPVDLPRRVVHNLCSAIDWVEVAGTAVTSRVALDRRRELSTIELALARIFDAFGPVLSFRQVVDLGGDVGLNRNSIGVLLTRTPILTRVERGRYALRGRAVRVA
jgi:hypothetical protein